MRLQNQAGLTDQHRKQPPFRMSLNAIVTKIYLVYPGTVEKKGKHPRFKERSAGHCASLQ